MDNFHTVNLQHERGVSFHLANFKVFLLFSFLAIADCSVVAKKRNEIGPLYKNCVIATKSTPRTHSFPPSSLCFLVVAVVSANVEESTKTF